LETDDIHIISTAYRDFNKSQFNAFRTSESEVLILDLLSELNTVCRFNQGYFNETSMELLRDVPDYTNLSHIEKFRALPDNQREVFNFLDQYERLIIIKPDLVDDIEADFLNALYELIQEELHNHLVLILPAPPEQLDYFYEQIDFYDSVDFSLLNFT